LILQEASRVFREQPYSEVSLDTVASEAGVTRGLLHHYFGSKRNLYLAVLEQAVSIPAGVEIVPAGSFADLRELFDACVGLWMSTLRAAGGLWPGASVGFAEADIDDVMEVARTSLVERMIDELPFPETLDRDSLRAALHAYAAFASVASDAWLRDGRLNDEQLRAMLSETLVAIAESIVPAMGAASR